MESVFIVECYSGDRIWIGGVFDSYESAKTKKDELHTKALLVQSNCPETEDDDYDHDYYYANLTEMEWEEPEIKEYKKHNGLGSQLIWHLSKENKERMDRENIRYVKID